MNQEPNQKNANQIWVDMVCDQVNRLFAKVAPVANMPYKELIKLNNLRRGIVCEIIVNYSNTRWRVFADEIIVYLDLVKNERVRVDAEYKACWGIWFKKKRILYNQAISLEAQQQAYQNALLVIINTLPPTPVQPAAPMKAEEGGLTAQDMVEADKEFAKGTHLKVDKSHVNGSTHEDRR